MRLFGSYPNRRHMLNAAVRRPVLVRDDRLEGQPIGGGLSSNFIAIIDHLAALRARVDCT
jgi:hypothetical protein